MTKSNQDTSTKREVETMKVALQQLQSQKLSGAASDALEMTVSAFNSLVEDLGGHEERERLAALYEVSQTLGTSLDLDEVLDQVMDAVIGLTGAERGFLVLLEDGIENPKMRVGRNLAQEDLDGMEVSRTVLKTVAETGKGMVTEDAQADPRFSGQSSVINLSLRSVMAAPLRSRDEVVGVIYVDNRMKSGIFDEPDLKMLNAFAFQAATAIQNARLYADTDRTLGERVRELENLVKVARDLNNQEGVEEVLVTTQRWTKDLLKASEVWVAIPVEEAGRSFLRIELGPRDGEEISKDDPVVKGPMEALTPHVFSAEGDTPERLAAPLLSGSQAVGVLVAESVDGFAPEALPFLTRLAGQVALAMEKARMQGKIGTLMEDKANFISIITHELRLPMTSIQGYTDLLKQGAMGEVNEQQLNFLTVIRNNVGRMNRLVSDISDVSKLESGQVLLESANFSVGEAVSEMLEEKEIKELLESKKQAPLLNMADGLPEVFGDRGRVQQVARAMVDNASKYSGEEGMIEVSIFKEADHLKVMVRDMGLGVDAAEQGQMFEQFFRSERQEIRDVQGWGLNLAVAKGLVELMGGEIGFESATDAGSTFWFTVGVE